MFNTGKFAGKTIVISGASRGIGKEIALKLAKDKANIVICAKTAAPHAKLPGTIYSAAEEIEKLGGKALPCVVDVRDESAVQNAVEEAVKKFGGIDVLINNASAISLTGTLDTSMKKYDLMNGVNTRGTFLMSQKCIPYLKQASNPHILNLSPPLLMEPKWFANHVAYTIAKYGMSMCVLGMYEELRADGIAVNALWPKTTIWTAAMEMLSSGEGEKGSRKPDIVADAAYCILKRSARDYTGNFAIDEDVLKEEGVTDFDKYANDPSHPLMPDFFISDADFKSFSSGKREKSRAAIKAADVTAVLDNIKKVLSTELVQKLGAVYEFTIKDPSGVRHAFIDLKNGAGSVGEGKPEKSEVQFECDSDLFVAMFRGEIAPTKAFMSGKLKIRGAVTQAIALESVLKKLNK